MKCGCCGHDVNSNGLCQVDGCKEEAMYEGWYENKDFSGNKVGLSRLLKVCGTHRKVLIGGNKQ